MIMAEQNMYEEEQQPQTRKSSPAKALVARSKVRDESGRFVSNEEQQRVLVQKQQLQFEAERARVNSLLGRQTQTQTQEQTPMQMPQQEFRGIQSNFESIIMQNKVGSESDHNRWNTLLGKNISKDNSLNRRIKNNNKKYKWW